MSLKYRDSQGNETPVAGLNGTSGELVPSISVIRTGQINLPATAAGAWNTFEVTFDTPMPDADYQVIMDNSNVAYVHVQAVRSKSVNGFGGILYTRDAIPSTTQAVVNYTAFKLMTDESRALDEAAIAALQENALQYTLLGSGDDIDTLIQPGNYGGYNGDGIGGTFPYVGNSQFSLLVTKAREYRYQLLQAGEKLYQRYVGVSGSTIGTWSSWSSYIPESALTSAVTSGSTAPVTSGGVFSALAYTPISSPSSSSLRGTSVTFTADTNTDLPAYNTGSGTLYLAMSALGSYKVDIAFTSSTIVKLDSAIGVSDITVSVSNGVGTITTSHFTMTLTRVTNAIRINCTNRSGKAILNYMWI